jgi:TldD protein
MKKKEWESITAAMEAELARAQKGLRAPEHPRPYFLSYLVRSSEYFNVWGRYGTIWQERQGTRRSCYADVRVGSHSYDQIAHGGLQDNSTDSESFDMTELPIDVDIDGVRFALWRLTDARFREAVADYYARKSRDLSFVDQNRDVPSFTRSRAALSHLPLKVFKADRARAHRFVKGLSRVFKSFSEIKNSYVEWKERLQTKIFMSTEGVGRTWQEPLIELSIYFWFLGSTHEDQGQTLVYYGRTPEELPSPARIERDIRARIELAYALDRAVKINSYAGPVLLSGKASGLFLHEAVGHRLEASRFLSDDEGRAFMDKVGKKVTHQALSIRDDPTLLDWEGQPLIGAYPFDDEGVSASNALLIDRGVVSGFLSTRSPFNAGKKRHRSNGHARSEGFQRPMSRMANLVVTGEDGLPWKQMKQALIEEVTKRGLEFGIVLYGVEGGETGTDAYDFQAFLGEITQAARIFPDGREELVKGVDFVGTPLSTLNQILAVGSDHHVDNGYCGAESGMLPVSTVSPPLLLANLELQSKSPAKVTQYILPLPWETRK